MTAGPSDGRRVLTLVVALLVAGGAASLWSSSLVWAVQQVRRPAPMPSIAYSIDGATAVPMTVALGLVALAAVVAVLATGQLGRRIVGGVVLATALWSAVAVYQYAALPLAEQVAVISADGTKHAIQSAPEPSGMAGPLAVAAVTLTAGAALALALTARRMPRMGRKYEREQGRPATPRATVGEARDRDMWSSLDRGEDPTD